MILNSRATNFWFKFPQGFFPKNISEKWLPWVKRYLIPYDTIETYMESSIQSVTFPTINMDPVTQVRHLGKKQEYKSSVPVQDLFTREMTVTFRSYEGWTNYWIFRDTMLQYLDFHQKDGGDKDLYFEDFQLRMLNQEGFVVNTNVFKGMYFKNLSEISLSMSDNNPEFKTFTAGFGFFSFETRMELD